MRLPHLFSFCFLMGILLVAIFAPRNKVVYCGKKLSLPDRCKLLSNTSVESDSFSMQWIHVRESILDSLATKMIRHFEQEHEVTVKKSVRLLSYNSPLEGYAFTYKEEFSLHGKILAFGKVDEQAVIVSVDLKKNTFYPLPLFVRSILQLESASITSR